MESQRFTNIRQYLDIVARRKKLILSCILLGISCGLIFYLTQEKIYQGQALLSYQQQKVSPSQMSPDEEAGIRDIVSTLSQIVTSRSSLEEIIINEELYPEVREILPMEDVVQIMRRNINIVQDSRGDTFVIEYLGVDPKKVAKVTNMLAERFIEENMQYREERAAETSVYTQNELEMAKKNLDQKEAVMRDYKLKYYNEMPDQRQMNMSRLIALQDQYQGRQESIQDLERTRVLIRDQISVRKQIMEVNEQSILQRAAEQGSSTNIELDQLEKLELLKNDLAEIKERYTDQHPQVKRLKKQIASLEQLIKEEDTIGEEDGGPQIHDEELFALQIRIKEIGLSIQKLEQEKDETLTLINKYEQWVESAPVREAEWSSLTREYGEMKRQYDFLVAQNLQALSALNLEVSQKGSQFKIEDPARRPETPIKPNFRKIMILAIFGGVMAGALLAVGLEVTDTSFKSQFDVENSFDIPVIGAVPNFSLEREKAKQRFWSVTKTVFFLIWISAICFSLVEVRNDGKIIATIIGTIN